MRARDLRFYWYDVRDLATQAASVRSWLDVRALLAMAGWRIRYRIGDAWRATRYGITKATVYAAMAPARVVAVLTRWAMERAREDKRVCEEWRRFRDDACEHGQRLIALTPEGWKTSHQYAWVRGVWLLACEHEAAAFRRWTRWYHVARSLIALEHGANRGVLLGLRLLTFVQGRRWSDVLARLGAPSC